jgi:molybdopterin-binding protein
MALVSAEAAGYLWRLMLLEYKDSQERLAPGKAVFLVFKETELILLKTSDDKTLSLINQIPARIKELQQGDFMAKVVLAVGRETVKGVFLKETVEKMDLKEGQKLFFSVKSNEIALLY